MNARRRAKLAAQQRVIEACPHPSHGNPCRDVNWCRQQKRHERRVFGHTAIECDCTPEQVNTAVEWNQPPPLWMGGGHAYRRRQKARARGHR